MTKKEALKRLNSHIDKLVKSNQDITAEALLDFIEDQEVGLSMYPPMNNKGGFDWTNDEETA